MKHATMVAMVSTNTHITSNHLGSLSFRLLESVSSIVRTPHQYLDLRVLALVRVTGHGTVKSEAGAQPVRLDVSSNNSSTAKVIKIICIRISASKLSENSRLMAKAI